MRGLAESFRDTVLVAVPIGLYRLAHDATIRVQHADDTIDVDVDTPEIGALSDVPLRVGIPGARVLVADGMRCRVAFINGDRTQPYAFGVDADFEAYRGVARVGDTVDLGTLVYVGPGTLTWTHPDPLHIPPQFVGTIPLEGIISTGSGMVKLGDE